MFTDYAGCLTEPEAGHSGQVYDVQVQRSSTEIQDNTILESILKSPRLWKPPRLRSDVPKALSSSDSSTCPLKVSSTSASRGVWTIQEVSGWAGIAKYRGVPRIWGGFKV